VIIRRIEARDEAPWRALWDAYNRFYEREPSESVTRRTWTHILDATSDVYAIVAEREGDGVVGMANYIIHESTSALRPVCYLQDLFVDPGCRGGGVGVNC
jgi:GNAT superfamily N-acetyltransferase